MTYTEESLTPGEKILKLTHYHWFYMIGAIINAVMLTVLAGAIMFLAIIYHYYDIVKLPPWMIHKAAAELALSDYMRAFWHTNPIARVVALLMILSGLVQIGVTMLVRATTEIAVTNRRLILKRGLVSRKVEEMRVDFIEGADVNQTIMGRIFGYGQIKTYGTGTENIYFPKYTADAIGFRRAIQAARGMAPGPSGPQFGQDNQQQNNNFPDPARDHVYDEGEKRASSSQPQPY